MKTQYIAQSKAKRIRSLIQKKRKLILTKESLVDFDEPVLFLARRNRTTEVYEGATKGEFPYKHSDGEERKLNLDPAGLDYMDYGKKRFSYYYCHEDYPLPLKLCMNPVVAADLVALIQEKTLHDLKKWGASEKIALGKMWKSILIGIAAIIGIYVVAGLILPKDIFNKLLFWQKSTPEVSSFSRLVLSFYKPPIPC